MIRALIIDDEVRAANVLQLMIERYIPEITQLRIATQAGEARVMIEVFKPQLVFQDIVMPGKNGFELLNELQEINFEIIFTTAYDEYAIRAIRFSALDYLLKPINAEELKAALKRFAEKKEKLQPGVLVKNLLHNLEHKNDFKLAVPTVNGALFFPPSEIIRLEGESNYSRFCLTGGRKYLSAKTMRDYEEILVQYNFLRIHKSHLVNKTFIESYQNEGSVMLTDKTILPVSRQRKQEVAAILKKK